MRALIVDDSPDFRALAARLMAAEWPRGTVDTYDPIERGQPGSDFPWSHYDVVLLDYRLGIADGLDWLREWRADPDFPPVIFMTAGGSEDVAVRAMKLGAADYVRKDDLTRQRLAEVIREAAIAPRRGPPAPRYDPLPRQADVIGGYRLGRQIGSGAQATVFLAEPERGGAPVVMKILHRGMAVGDGYLERFIREYGVISRIDSRHVVRIYDQGFTDAHAFIVMEHLPAGDLKDNMQGGVRVAQAVRHFCQLVSALHAIHQAGVIHRDLKPRNILFRDPETLVVADFGIARDALDARDYTRAGMVVGTPAYMSPEQAMGKPVDARSDFYSAGIMFYELLTGDVPFTGPEQAAILYDHCHTQPPPLPPGLARFQPLVSRLLTKDPTGRPGDGVAILDAIEL